MPAKPVLIAIGLLTAIFASSCEKEVDISIPAHEPLIVVNALFKSGDSMNVHISTSGHISEPLLQGLGAATVILYSGNNTNNLLPGKNGWYSSAQKAIEGGSYKLEVTYDSYKQVIATDYVPHPVSFGLANYIPQESVDDWGHIFSSIDVLITDNAAQTNYYEIEVRPGAKIRSVPNSGYNAGTKSNSMIIKNEGYTGEIFTKSLVFSDALFNGKTIALKIGFAYNNNVDHTIVSLRSVSENYYRFKKSLYRYEENSYADIWNTSNPVGLYSNIENGFGIFAGYSEVCDSAYTYTGEK